MGLLSRIIAKGSNKAKLAAPSPSRYGTVTSVDGQTAYVTVDGNTEPTPCTTSVRCRVGQRVMVEVRNGMAVVTGNVTSPSPDGATIDDVIEDVDGVRRLVRETTDGTLIAQVGQPFGSLVAADGGVYVVSLTWDDEEPTAVSAWNTIDEDGLVYVNMGVSGQPYFKTDGDNLEVGLGSGTRMLFRRAGMSSARDGSSMLLAIGSGQNTFQEDFAVLSDGSVVACDGKARFGGDASYLYLRDSGSDIWRIVKSSGDVQGYVNGAWRSLYFLATQSRAANTVLAAPNGNDGTPSFRALAHADMPKSGWAYLIGSDGAASYVRMRVVSGFVWIQANIASGLTITANGVTVNSSEINVAYRPDREVTAPIYHSSNNTGCMWMDTSGYLHMSTKASASQTTAYGELVYPLS